MECPTTTETSTPQPRMIRYVVLYFTTKVYNSLHAHFMHRLYTAPECHQTQTFGVCMNEVNSHMRRTKRRLLPFRRVQSTDARPCHMHAPINIRGLFRFLLRVVPSGWLANYCSRTKLTLLTHAVVPLGATSHMIQQKVPPLELLWGPVLPPITMVVYIVGGKKNNYVGLVPVNQFRRDTARPFLHSLSPL